MNFERELLRVKMINDILKDAYKYIVIYERTKKKRIKRKSFKKIKELEILFLIWSY